MEEKVIYPFRHPTTCAFLDDNTSFLKGVDLAMDPKLAYVAFENEHRAIRYINQSPELPHLSDRLVAQREASILPEQRGIALDSQLLEQEINNPERFHQISVVVVDYSMPNIDGIGFCNAIDNPSVGKILLTGAADEATAVSAFNRGEIDRFVPKNITNCLEQVKQFISELESRYFENMISNTRNSLTTNTPSYFSDQQFRDSFSAFRSEIGCTEYYFVTEPEGFLILDGAGRMFRLIVSSTADLTNQLALASRKGAPDSILDKLRSRELMPFSLVNEETYETGEYHWEENLFPARSIGVGSDWFMTLVPDPPLDIDFSANRCSYNVYLEALDLVHEE